jgi:enoyl-CoA hydratase/carnithine racemase
MASLVTITQPDDHGVATITLSRAAKRNALSIALRDEMSDALDELEADEACRVVVVAAKGAVFSAGFDLDEFIQPELAEQLWASSDRWHRTILEFPLPLVAAVNGGAFGGGFDLAVMCDLRVASKSARFAHPEHAFSQVVYGPLHDLVGGSVARDLALTGRSVDASEAHVIGLVNRVVPDHDVERVAHEVAAVVAEAPREVLLAMKAKIKRGAGIALGGTLDL